MDVAHPELTPVFSFRGYFPIAGNTAKTGFLKTQFHAAELRCERKISSPKPRL